MPFRDDPRIDRLETLAARLSRMYHAAHTLHERQRGNLTRVDWALAAEFERAHREALALLWDIRQGETGPPGRE